MDVKDRSKIANETRYHDGVEVTNYLCEDYHKVRINIALNMLNNEFDSDCRNNIRILELASADGSVGRTLKEFEYDVFCTDISIDQLSYLKSSGISVLECDASDTFPFADGLFDGVFAGDIIEHLFDIDTFFKECSRVLKPGGILVITTPNLAALQDRFRFLFGHSPKQIQPYHEFYKLHIRPFTLKMLKYSFKKFGFEVKGCSSNFVIWKVWGRYILYSRVMARLVPAIGRSLIVCGRKI